MVRGKVWAVVKMKGGYEVVVKLFKYRSDAERCAESIRDFWSSRKEMVFVREMDVE